MEMMDEILEVILGLANRWEENPDEEQAWNEMNQLSISILILDNALRSGEYPIPTPWRTNGPE